MTIKFNVEVVTPDGVDQYEEIDDWRVQTDGPNLLIVTVFEDHQVVYAAGAWLKVESESVEVRDGS